MSYDALRNPVDTRRRFNVYTTSTTSYRRRIDVEATSCVYWENTEINYQINCKLQTEYLSFSDIHLWRQVEAEPNCHFRV